MDAKRIKIAEFGGWERVSEGRWGFPPEGGPALPIPYYFSDLNAIQSVIESKLLAKDWTLFIDNLALITGAYSQNPPLRWMMLINASAKDKAEALYETIISLDNKVKS